jgi:pimeloyl-ACP methyl ester carboxylesterase
MTYYEWNGVASGVGAGGAAATPPLPVLCVHGLTRNASDFGYLAAALAAAGHRVIAVDVAGRGASDWLKTATNYNYGAGVCDVLR